MSSDDVEIERLVLHHREKERQLQSTVADLLSQVDTLQSEVKIKSTQLHVLEQVRKANQNLVISAVDAQTTQANAEAINVRQEEFLSMLAHELRNPLLQIVSATELIGKIITVHPDIEELPELHSIIGRQIEQMNRLVDDLLDAARISTGKITLLSSLININDVIERALETSRPYFKKRHQQIDIILPSTTVIINGDLDRLIQVLTNLLINASKFTPEFGTILVSTSQMDDMITLSVQDNGMGIPLHIQSSIFELFTQGIYSKYRSQGGLGIGLALAKMIVEMHGGTIDVYSMGTGFGSNFTVSLPVSTNVLLMKANQERIGDLL